MKIRSGFTIIELLVVIAIISTLAAIIFPVFAAAREKARQTTCLSNLKQIGLAITQYTQDYDEQFVPSENGSGIWWQIIAPYAQNVPSDSSTNPNSQASYLTCPSDTTSIPGVGYALNGFVTEDPRPIPSPSFGLSLAAIGSPSEVMLAADSAKVFEELPPTTDAFTPSDFIRIENINAALGGGTACVRTGSGVTDACVSYMKNYVTTNFGDGCDKNVVCDGIPAGTWAAKAIDYRHSRASGGYATGTGGFCDFVFIDGHAKVIAFRQVKTYNFIPNETDAQRAM